MSNRLREISRLRLPAVLLGALLITLSGAAFAAVHIDGRVDFLVHSGEKEVTVVPGSVRFAAPPARGDLAALHALGVEFFDFGHGLAGSRTVFPVRFPVSALAELARMESLVAVDCAWRPLRKPPLAVSRPQVEADQAWQVGLSGGGTLSGAGVLVCDVDTGVNYNHANFFKLSGETYHWLDVNSNGVFNRGDAVDLDHDGIYDAGEGLDYHEAANITVYGNSSGSFDAGLDFLFNDANGNGARDHGAPAYGENDPCYGELILVVDDADGDGVLDPGETLHGLGESRIRAIYNSDGTVHRRGVDLLESDADDWGHGSQVSGIMGGGWRGLHAMSGVAPGIETIHVNLDYGDEPPFLLPIEAGLAWAVAEGADVLLIEDGEWVWEYMDGSSNVEVMMNEFAEQGIVVVCAAGNLSSGHQHARFQSGAVQQLAVDPAYSIVWTDFLWTDAVSLSLQITPPGGTPVTLPLNGTTLFTQGYKVYSNLSVSPRGTRRLDLRLSSTALAGSVGGTWSFQFGGPDTELHAYYGDDAWGWSTSSRWTLGEDPAWTVTWPATADSCISVAAYAPDGDAEIHAYSGWGPRIDGTPAVSIAAPGTWVFSVHPQTDMDFSYFSGTSAAAPHVAGAAALLKELFPDLDHGRCRQILMAGAQQDAFTTDRDRAGAGKLRIHQALVEALSAVAESPPHPSLTLQAYPNPFNPATVLSFRLPGAGEAQVRLFDLAGRNVWSKTIAVDAPGVTQVTWDGRDHAGHGLPSGVYFAHVRQGGVYGACKLTLVK